MQAKDAGVKKPKNFAEIISGRSLLNNHAINSPQGRCRNKWAWLNGLKIENRLPSFPYFTVVRTRGSEIPRRYRDGSRKAGGWPKNTRQ